MDPPGQRNVAVVERWPFEKFDCTILLLREVSIYHILETLYFHR